MNTQAHIMIGQWLFKKKLKPKIVFLASVAPDAPMFFFYAWVKLVQGKPEAEIWSTTYFQESWQNFFDIFNSFPLAIVLILVGWKFEKDNLTLIGLCFSLHFILDLPLHHDDGHRHFFPLSDFRFSSPVSYWDPQHFGWIMAPIEAGIYFILGSLLFNQWKLQGRTWFVLGGLIYLPFLLFSFS